MKKHLSIVLFGIVAISLTGCYTQLVIEEDDDRYVYQVHYECVVAQLMWIKMKKWRLHPERKKYKPKFHSIQSVPDQESWMLAMSFSNPRKSITLSTGGL